MVRTKVEFRVSASGTKTLSGNVGVMELEPISRRIAGQHQEPIRNVQVRVGETAPAHIVSVQPGKYVVRLRLPSGKAFTELVAIEHGSDLQRVTLVKPSQRKKEAATRIVARSDAHHAGSTKFEFLSDVSLFENVLPSRNFERHVATTRHGPTRHVADPKVRNLNGGPEDFSRYVTRRINQLERHDPQRGSDLEILSCAGFDHSQLATVSDGIRTNFNQELFSRLKLYPDSRAFNVRQDPKKRTSRFIIDWQKHEHLPSAYVLMTDIFHSGKLGEQSSLKAKLIRVPGYWKTARGDVYHTVLDIVRKSKAPAETNITVNDRAIQSLIDFSQRKDLSGALTVLDESVELLFEKSRNPYAAAAAGYVLLQAPPDALLQPWQSWIRNLGERYEDVPDGLIQHATLLLQRSPTEFSGDLDFFPKSSEKRARLAADLSIRALARGLPIYRSGLALLLANLRILQTESGLSSSQCSKINAAVELVSALRLRLDPQQPFTTLNLSLSS